MCELAGLTSARFGAHEELRIRRLEPILQEFLLKADEGTEHGFILDLCGGDYNAAVHEIGHSVHQFSGALCLQSRLIEHLEADGESITSLMFGGTFLCFVCSEHYYATANLMLEPNSITVLYSAWTALNCTPDYQFYFFHRKSKVNVLLLTH